ncbi:hypothetical protein BKA69DRAFT_1128513 [Paraphysoderma sedebokerense]|nr:hypothetical protein BKA69DRAFT_1128513 [Paraphysoderma sedebokerense]
MKFMPSGRPYRSVNMLAAFCFVLLILNFSIEVKSSIIPAALPSIKVTEVNPAKWSDLPSFGFYPPTCTDCVFASDDVSEVAFSSYKWTINKEVKLTLKSPRTLLRPTMISVELFRLEYYSTGTRNTVPSNIPKHVRVGLIMNKYQLIPNKEYTATFRPPSFLTTGKYLLVISHFSPNHVNFDSIGEPVTTEVFFDRKSAMSQGSIALENASNVQPELRTKGMNVNRVSMNDLPVDIIGNSLNAMESTVEVCALCSSSKALQSTCDYMFAESTFLPAVPLPDPPAMILLPEESSQSKLSTSKICQLADVETLLKRLEFKYISIFDFITVQSQNFTHPINQLKSLMSTQKNNDRVSFWAYPDLYRHLVSQMALRFNFLIVLFDKMFSTVYYDKVRKIEISNGEGQISLDELKQRLHNLKVLPNSVSFVEQLVKKIRFTLTPSGIMISPTEFSMVDIKASLKVLRPRTIPRPDMISLFDGWLTTSLRKKIDTFMEIFEF